MPFENGRPAGKAQDVVTGFLDGDQARGRPVGVAIDGTGALLIADDAGNTVWRVAAADGSVTPEPIGSDRVAAGAGGATVGQVGASRPSAGADAGPAYRTRRPVSPQPETPMPPQMEVAPAVLPDRAVQEDPAQQKQ